MYTISQRELERRTNLNFETVLGLYLKGEISPPIIYGNGRYDWNFESIANFIVNNFDLYGVSPENREYWNSFIGSRSAMHEKELMHAPKNSAFKNRSYRHH